MGDLQRLLGDKMPDLPAIWPGWKRRAFKMLEMAEALAGAYLRMKWMLEHTDNFHNAAHPDSLADLARRYEERER